MCRTLFIYVISLYSVKRMIVSIRSDCIFCSLELVDDICINELCSFQADETFSIVNHENAATFLEIEFHKADIDIGIGIDMACKIVTPIFGTLMIVNSLRNWQLGINWRYS